ncbi:VOC family protein [Blastococcus sp. SYSU D00669]
MSTATTVIVARMPPVRSPWSAERVTARITDICVDARDHRALADWWCAALGYVRRDADGPPSDPVAIEDPTGRGPLLWFNQVPEPKTVENRVHFDVDGDTDELLAAGATLLRRRDDVHWDVLADPEGNEFCVFPPGD